MGMYLVVVLHPSPDLGKGQRGGRDRIYLDIVALEGPHEGLAHAVALGAGDWCEAWNQSELGSEDAGLAGPVGRTIVGQELDRVRRPRCAKAPFDGLKHQVQH